MRSKPVLIRSNCMEHMGINSSSMTPSSNKRTDEYGENSAKFGIEVIQAVKSVMPEEMPFIMRVSAIEYVDDGYGIEHCIDLAKQFKEVASICSMFHQVGKGYRVN